MNKPKFKVGDIVARRYKIGAYRITAVHFEDEISYTMHAHRNDDTYTVSEEWLDFYSEEDEHET